MLERLPQTRSLIRDPKNKKMKRFIDASVAANTPLLERIMSGKGLRDDITMLIHSMFEQKLEFSTRLPKNLLSFARKAALAWDLVSMEERESFGLDPELCKQISPASNYFGNMHRGNTSLGLILDHANNAKSMLKRRRLLFDLQHGNVPFEQVKEFFFNEAKESLELSSFSVRDEGVVLVGMRVKQNEENKEVEYVPGEVRLVYNNIYPHILECEQKLSLLKDSVANRLIVGYSPVI